MKTCIDCVGGVYQGPALEALWQQCCSDCAPMRSTCCDAMVLLVDQGHADLHYVLNSVLNLLPSARYTKHTHAAACLMPLELFKIVGSLKKACMF